MRYPRFTNQPWMPFAAVLLAILFAAPVIAQPSPEFADFRGLWVTRFDYRTGNTATVQEIIDNAATLGVTDIMFQVRGQSDAYYDSNFETRAQGLSTSWDPLQVAIDRAHGHGMKLHAWVNSAPLWNGTSAPTDPSHVFYNDDPSYRIFDIAGNPQPLQSGYVIANPISPQWQTHVNNVANDIVSNYNVDGLHLDYIRWLGSTSWSSLPHDGASHALFTQTTGLAATSANAGAYRDFIRDRITNLVSDISTTVHTANPAAQLSAAVWRDPDVGNNDYLQNYREWLEQDLLDIAIPMIYLSESNNYLLQPNLANTLSIETNTRIVPGLGIYLHDDPNFSVQQLQTIYNMGAQGAMLYAYSSFFEDGQLGVDRFNAVKTYLDSLKDAPVGSSVVMITDFENGEGYFNWSPTLSGTNEGVLSGTTATRSTVEAHSGSASQRISVVGESNGWTLRHLSGIGSVANQAGNLPLEPLGHIGFWLKTSSDDMTVQLTLDDPTTGELSIAKDIKADGQWHLYEWDLEDAAQWMGWVNGDGTLDGPIITLDSIQFHGSGNAVFYLDDVFYRTIGYAPEPGTLALLLLSSLIALRRRTP